MPAKVRYISGIPGIGKTRWAILRMTECLDSEKGIILYVSPTGDLLGEVYRQLIEARPGRANRVYNIYGDHVQSGSVVSTLKLRLTGGINQLGVQYKAAPQGSIFLVTHEGFIRVTSPFPRAKELEVIFDESRKCVAQGKVLNFSSLEQQQALEECLIFDKDATVGSFSKVTSQPGAWVTFKNLSAERGCKLTHTQTSIFQNFFALTRNPRVDIYIGGRANSKKTSFNTFEVMLPSKVFEGFKRVTLLSAYFEDSQMYHLLKQQNIRLTDITFEVPEYSRRRGLLIERYKQVTLVSLTPQEISLSLSSQLGFMIDFKYADIFDKLKEAGISTPKELRALREIYLDSNAGRDKRYHKALDILAEHKEHLVTSPVMWMLQESRKIIRNWMARYHIKKVKKPLLVLNKRIASFALQHDADAFDNFELISTSVHGLNKYSNRNVIAFLAAINPTPDLIRLYRTLLPEYDFEKDHVADICVQCACRLSVRDTEAVEPVLVITPDHRINGLLYDRLYKSPSLGGGDLGPKRDMIFFNQRFYFSALKRRDNAKGWEIRKKAIQAKKNSRRVLSNPNIKQINVINALLSKLRKKQTGRPGDPVLISREKTLIAKRKALTDNRTVSA